MATTTLIISTILQLKLRRPSIHINLIKETKLSIPLILATVLARSRDHSYL